jgi:hypothetical protein
LAFRLPAADSYNRGHQPSLRVRPQGAKCTLPYKDILEVPDSGEPIVLGEPVGFVARVWTGNTNEWPCHVLSEGHVHLVWKEGETMYRCCHGVPKGMGIGEANDAFLMALDRIVEGLPLITKLTEGAPKA